MKQKKWLIGLIALGLVLAACGSGGSKTTSNEPATQKINVASGGELSTLDSAHYTDVYSSDMIGQVVEGLYRQDKNGDPELAMAKAEPQVSEDGLVYTFKLREAKWTNGDPVKAGDFVVAFRNVVDQHTVQVAVIKWIFLKMGVRCGKDKPRWKNLVSKQSMTRH